MSKFKTGDRVMITEAFRGSNKSLIGVEGVLAYDLPRTIFCWYVDTGDGDGIPVKTSEIELVAQASLILDPEVVKALDEIDDDDEGVEVKYGFQSLVAHCVNDWDDEMTVTPHKHGVEFFVNEFVVLDKDRLGQFIDALTNIHGEME